MRKNLLLGMANRVPTYLVFLLFASMARGELFHISIPRYEVKDNRVIVEGFGSILESGKPWLPSRVVWIAVPPGSKIIRCKVRGMLHLLPQQVGISTTFQPDTCFVTSVPTLVREGSSPLKVTSHKEQGTSENAIYPDSVGKYLGIFKFRGYKFAKVLISPFVYNQKLHNLWWAPEITINLDYTPPIKSIQVDTALDNLFPLSDEINGYGLLNFDEVNKWCERTLLDSYDYVIVVPEELRAVVKDFAEWKETIGYKVKVVSWEQINEIKSPKYILAIGDSMVGAGLPTSTGIVGRIPYMEAELLRSILERTIEFEINDISKRVLFVKGVSNYENEDFSGVPQEDKSMLLKELESIIPVNWNYEDAKGEVLSGDYSIVNFLSLSKNWLWDDGDGVPESNEIRLAKYFLCSGSPSLVFAPFDAREFLKQGAICVVAPDSGAFYIPGWANVSDGGWQSFNYMFLRCLAENEIVGNAFIQAKFWYETYFPFVGDKRTGSPQEFKIWGDPSLNLHGIPEIDIGITGTPVKWLLPDSAFSPVCLVRNFGRAPEINCKVYCEIDSNGVPVYMESFVVDTVETMGEKIAEFPKWNGHQIGVDYSVKFEVFSHRDKNPSNDTISVLARVAGGDFLVSDTVLNNVLCELGYKGVYVDESEKHAPSGAEGSKMESKWIKNFKVLFVSEKMDSIPDSANLYIEGSNLLLNKLLPGKKLSERLVSPVSGMGFSFDYQDTTLEWFLPDNYDTVFSDGAGKVCGFSCEDRYKVWCTRFRFSEIPDSLRIPFIEKAMSFFEVSASDDSSSCKEEDIEDLNITLFSCLPNPFSRGTNIRFKIQKEPTEINLSVYNLAGNLVRKLFDDALEVGEHELSWDSCDEGGKPVVNGIYFLRLQSKKESKLLKLIVFR